MKPWFGRHKPSRFTELYFSDDSSFKFIEWLRKASKGSVLHLTGPIGSGKTCLVHASAKVLGLNVIEYVDTMDVRSISDSRNLDGLKSILLVDEPAFISKFFNLCIPVVFTSSSMFMKEIETIKIQRPESSSILKAVKSILAHENRSLDDRIIMRLCEMTNYDFRSVINYSQIFSDESTFPGQKNLRMIERIAEPSTLFICKTLLSRRQKLDELEKIYSDKVLGLCINSILNNCVDNKVLKAIESVSEISMFPDKFQFLSLDNINKIQCDFVYCKEEHINIDKEFKGQNDLVHFLPYYNKSPTNTREMAHLQSIVRRYNKESSFHIELRDIEERVFRYKYNIGSSAAVQRDVKITELYDHSNNTSS